MHCCEFVLKIFIKKTFFNYTIYGVIPCQITKKYFFCPVSPNWLMFGTSVAWYVYKTCHLSQFRIVLEICPIKFTLFWGFYKIGQPQAAPIATCFYTSNYLYWIPVGMKIGKSIFFEVENQKMKVETLRKIRFWLKCGSYESE